MHINSLFSTYRPGKPYPIDPREPRTEYQRDFDRIVFSSPFRRLQNKTQVFPLPGSVFVHNRLTHSLEVASVGRSIGSMVGQHIADKYKTDLSDEAKEFYSYNLNNVIASACLCHDIGNPAFGHSGEDAISAYFRKEENAIKEYFTEKQWLDLINFEGNANAIRILTHQQTGKSEGGVMLTSSTLAAIAKYPCESVATNKSILHRKKYGFFQSEIHAFLNVAHNTGMEKDDPDPLIFFRHPFVWIVEAADDICYNIIDLEDAHRLGIIEHDRCVAYLTDLIRYLGNENMDQLEIRRMGLTDKNDQVALLRAKSINALIMQVKERYITNIDLILAGKLDTSLFDSIQNDCKALQEITKYSRDYIYNHRSVVQIENAGYNVMGELLNQFIPPTLKQFDSLNKAEKKALQLIPNQFLYKSGETYHRVMGVLDYVSGMTDNYATELYRKIKGIDIGMTI